MTVVKDCGYRLPRR